MTKVWAPVRTTIDVGEDGDILAPLKRVQNQYLNTGARHEAAGHPERAEYYQEQAMNIERLIKQ
jgi:hypothetical protein